MSKLFSRAAMVAVIALASTLVPGAAAQRPAQAAPAAAQVAPAAQAAAGVVGNVSSGPVRQVMAAAAEDYWTPQRMAAAKPLTPTVRRKLGSSPVRQRAAQPGPAVAVGGSAGSLGAPATAPRELTSSSVGVPRPYTNLPDRLNGKVFFSDALGFNYQCSGTVVNSENKSVVWTAGHCVHEGAGGDFYRNWVFIPAYGSARYGDRPYGTWAARELWTRGEFATGDDLSLDLGAAVVQRVGRVRLADRLGGQGIMFNAPARTTYRAYGYPATGQFNGESQFRCLSALTGRDAPWGFGPAPLKIRCTMNGGASGGGWVRDLRRSGLGYVASVNSYKYEGAPQDLYGPYFGNEAYSLYNSVRRRPA